MNAILNAGGYRRIIFEDDYAYTVTTRGAVLGEERNAFVELIRGILDTVPPRCEACFKTSASALAHCGRCNGAHSCGRDCQLADWKAGHKDECCKKRRLQIIESDEIRFCIDKSPVDPIAPRSCSGCIVYC